MRSATLRVSKSSVIISCARGRILHERATAGLWCVRGRDVVCAACDDAEGRGQQHLECLVHGLTRIHDVLMKVLGGLPDVGNADDCGEYEGFDSLRYEFQFGLYGRV